MSADRNADPRQGEIDSGDMFARFRLALRRRFCHHVLLYTEQGQPIYSLRPIRMTPLNHMRWWGFSLGEFTCPKCGGEFMDCRTDKRPL